MTKLPQIVGVLLLVLLLLVGLDQGAFAHGYGHGSNHGSEKWVYLGQTTVNGQRDYDKIHIGRSEGRFERIQLRVSGSPVEFQRIVINYANGDRDNFDVRGRVLAGGQTRAIDLRGGERSINSVEFFYSKANWSRHYSPRVSLFGVDVVRRPAPWTYLGQTAVSGHRDHDIFGIGRNEGRFRSIQLRVSGGTVEFHRIVIHYANGEREFVDVRDRIHSGGETRAIDLRGQERSIKSVELFYGNGHRHSRGARVSFYAR